jgi:hypothetical protein
MVIHLGLHAFNKTISFRNQKTNVEEIRKQEWKKETNKEKNKQAKIARK